MLAKSKQDPAMVPRAILDMILDTPGCVDSKSSRGTMLHGTNRHSLDGTAWHR